MTRDTDADTDLRHSEACTCAECRGHSNADTVAAIKEAHKNGRRMTHEEVIVLLNNPPALLNGCEKLPGGKRGPKSKHTYYDRRIKRLDGKEFTGWRWAWKHYVAVPESRRAAGKPTRDKIEAAAKSVLADNQELSQTALAKRVSELLPEHDARTIERHIETYLKNPRR